MATAQCQDVAVFGHYIVDFILHVEHHKLRVCLVRGDDDVVVLVFGVVNEKVLEFVGELLRSSLEALGFGNSIFVLNFLNYVT